MPYGIDPPPACGGLSTTAGTTRFLKHAEGGALCINRGSGKSTVFDVFSFLKDALATNVTKALNRRGGFAEVVTRGQDGPIEFEVKFREAGGRLATYILKIGQEGPRGALSGQVSAAIPAALEA